MHLSWMAQLSFIYVWIHDWKWEPSSQDEAQKKKKEFYEIDDRIRILHSNLT